MKYVHYLLLIIYIHHENKNSILLHVHSFSLSIVTFLSYTHFYPRNFYFLCRDVSPKLHAVIGMDVSEISGSRVCMTEISPLCGLA